MALFIFNNSLFLILVLLGFSPTHVVDGNNYNTNTKPTITMNTSSSRTNKQVSSAAAINQSNQKPRTSLAFASKSIPPPPPISVPVYSLASTLPLDSISSSQSNEDDVNTPNNVKTTSMNIMTFCTPVSVAPPKLWTLSLYTNTMTKEYFFKSKIGILQLLDKKQCDLVPILGKRSGYELDYSKELECEKKGFKWGKYGMSCKYIGDNIDNDDKEEEEEKLLQSIQLLPNCQSYIKVRLLETLDAGDHEVALCQVIGVAEWDEKDQCVVDVDPKDGLQAKDENIVLYTGYLRQEGII